MDAILINMTGMTEEAFWGLLQRAAERPAERERTEYVLAELLRLPARSAADFREHLRTARARVDTPGLRAAARVVLGGPLVPDTFWDFHLWLLSLGGPALERAVADPDTLADVPGVRALAGGWNAADHPGWASLAAVVDCEAELAPVVEGPTPPLPRLTALFGESHRPARNESDVLVVTVVW